MSVVEEPSAPDEELVEALSSAAFDDWVRFEPAGLTVDLECADTSTEDVGIVGGQVTSHDDPDTEPGSWLAVVIKAGDPDQVVIWFEADDDYGSCDELLEVSKGSLTDGTSFAEVADDDDIETA